MKTLYVTDLDGTLLNGEAKLSAYTAYTINDFIASGNVFTYATARSFVTASKVTSGLHITSPLIVYNGGFIVQPDGTALLKTVYEDDVANYVVNTLKANDVSPIVFSFIDGVERYSYCAGDINPGKEHFLFTRNQDRRERRVDDPSAIYVGVPFTYSCIGGEELSVIRDILINDPRLYLSYYLDPYSGARWCEIWPKAATKSTAICKLKAMLNCDRIVSFGDNVNDIPMFEISDECYAVENAVPELKRVATAIIESNNADGVARWLSAHK